MCLIMLFIKLLKLNVWITNITLCFSATWHYFPLSHLPWSRLQDFTNHCPGHTKFSTSTESFPHSHCTFSSSSWSELGNRSPGTYSPSCRHPSVHVITFSYFHWLPPHDIYKLLEDRVLMKNLGFGVRHLGVNPGSSTASPVDLGKLNLSSLHFIRQKGSRPLCSTAVRVNGKSICNAKHCLAQSKSTVNVNWADLWWTEPWKCVLTWNHAPVWSFTFCICILCVYFITMCFKY